MKPFEKQQRSRWYHLAMQALGWVLLVIGAIGGLIPIFQGWIFGLAGLIILSREYEWAHNLIEWGRRKFPRFAHGMDRFSEEAHGLLDRIFRRRPRAADSRARQCD